MIRRWLIRSCVLWVLAVLLAIGIASYFGGLDIRVDWRGRMWVANAAEGRGCFLIVPYEWSATPRVYPRFQRHTSAHDWQMDVGFPGFGYSDYVGIPHSHRLVFPLWAPALLLLGLLWLVWRKTKPKGAGRAFPVEVGATGPGQAEA